MLEQTHPRRDRSSSPVARVASDVVERSPSRRGGWNELLVFGGVRETY